MEYILDKHMLFLFRVTDKTKSPSDLTVMLKAPTFAHIEAKRFFAISTAVKLLPIEQFPSVVDNDSVPYHRLVSIYTLTLHNLHKGKENLQYNWGTFCTENI